MVAFPAPRSSRWQRFALAACAVLALALWAGSRIGADSARADTAARAQAAATLKVQALASELARHRLLPRLLAGDALVATALRTRDPVALQRLDRHFETLGAAAGAATIYLLDADGLTLAAGNWRGPGSFVDNRYAFRPYFQEGMRHGAAEHVALGTVSQQHGLYLSHRVDDGDRPMGLIVVKVVFDTLEQAWRPLADTALVVDERGAVLLGSVPAWRFQPLGGTPAAGEAAADAPPRLPATGGSLVRARLPGAPQAHTFSHVVQAVPGTAWTFHLLAPFDGPRARAVTVARATAVLLALCLLFAAGLALYRHQRAATAAQAREAARRELEATVAARTAALRQANARLEREMEERLQAEAGRQQAEGELQQASRLAFLGQIAAGVAHEINQPVAAIRSYADNATVFLDRGQEAPVRDNLSQIADLTSRIGQITDELRTFSRKSARASSPTPVAPALDGALTLLGHALRRTGTALRRPAVPPDLCVQADRVGLEQILVNLLQNAIEALAGQADGTLEIEVAADAADVRIAIHDDGPGIPPGVMETLFTPFTTTKPEGLGLGLVISRDIAASLGGTLHAHSAPGRTTFTLTLPRAQP